MTCARVPAAAPKRSAADGGARSGACDSESRAAGARAPAGSALHPLGGRAALVVATQGWMLLSHSSSARFAGLGGTTAPGSRRESGRAGRTARRGCEQGGIETRKNGHAGYGCAGGAVEDRSPMPHPGPMTAAARGVALISTVMMSSGRSRRVCFNVGGAEPAALLAALLAAVPAFGCCFDDLPIFTAEAVDYARDRERPVSLSTPCGASVRRT